MVLPCKCAHEAQDKIHGKGQRVFNPFKKGSDQYGRCTVCGTERQVKGETK